MLQGNPNFSPASFKGRGKVDGVEVLRRQLPLTMGGVIGELPEGETVARFGRLVSLKDGTKNTFVLGVGTAPLGVLISEEAIMQNSPAMRDGYFQGRAATCVYFGEVQYSRWSLADKLKAPSLGGKVLAKNDSGEIGFIDFNDTAPAGWTVIDATVVAVGQPNGATVFIGRSSLVVAGKGIDVSSVVGAPTASPAAGEVPVNTPVSLSTSTDGADIYYTLDGTVPSMDGAQLYDLPIVVDAAVTIKAVAVKTGMANSTILTAAYTIE
jgi:hypothetical protein